MQHHTHVAIHLPHCHTKFDWRFIYFCMFLVFGTEITHTHTLNVRTQQKLIRMCLLAQKLSIKEMVEKKRNSRMYICIDTIANANHIHLEEFWAQWLRVAYGAENKTSSNFRNWFGSYAFEFPRAAQLSESSVNKSNRIFCNCRKFISIAFLFVVRSIIQFTLICIHFSNFQFVTVEFHLSFFFLCFLSIYLFFFFFNSS